MSLLLRIGREINSPATLLQLGWTMLALGLAVLALRPLAFPGEPYLWGGDYNTFWGASWLVLQGKAASLYQAGTMQTIAPLSAPMPPWFYPPTMLLLVYPASLLPFMASYGVFVALSLLLALAVWKLWQLEKLHLVLLLASPALLINVLYGQNGLITAALWTGGLLLLNTLPFVAGCLLGLLIIKPQLALLAPICLMAGRHWKALGAMIFSATLLLDLSWLAFGPDLWLDFIINLPQVGKLLQDGSVVDVTKIGSLYMAGRLQGAGHVEALLMQGLVALFAVTILADIWRRKDMPFGNKAAAALVATLLISPYQFIYDLTLLLSAIAFWHQGNGNKWQGTDRLCVWLLWLSPLLAQGLASTFGIGCLPAILLLSLWRIATPPRPAA